MESQRVNNAIERIIKSENVKNYHLKVTKMCVKGENYLGDIRKVEVFDKDNNQRVKSLIVKLAPDWLDNMPLNLFYNREICAYTDIIPEFIKLQNHSSMPEEKKLNFAKFYEGSDTKNEEYLIMDDLTVENFKMLDKTKPLDIVHIELVFKSLAKFHALSYVLKNKSPDVYAKLESLTSIELNFGDISDEVMEGLATNILNAIKDPDHRDRLEKFMMNLRDTYFWYVAAATAAPYNVFSHGDCWGNNILFKYENGKPVDIRLIDWQLMRSASPITDLVYIVYICTEQDLRIKHLTRLFEDYYTTLADQIRSMGCDPESCYPKHVFDTHQKMLMRYGLAAALVNLPTLLIDENPSDGEPDEAFSFEYLFSLPLTESCVERINGVVEDFVRNGYLNYEDIKSLASQTALSSNKLS